MFSVLPVFRLCRDLARLLSHWDDALASRLQNCSSRTSSDQSSRFSCGCRTAQTSEIRGSVGSALRTCKFQHRRHMCSVFCALTHVSQVLSSTSGLCFQRTVELFNCRSVPISVLDSNKQTGAWCRLPLSRGFTSSTEAPRPWKRWKLTRLLGFHVATWDDVTRCWDLRHWRAAVVQHVNSRKVHKVHTQRLWMVRSRLYVTLSSSSLLSFSSNLYTQLCLPTMQ